MAIDELLENLYIPTQVAEVCDELEEIYNDLLSKNSSRYRSNYENGKEALDNFRSALNNLTDNDAQETPLFLLMEGQVPTDSGESLNFAMKYTSDMRIPASTKNAERRRKLFAFIAEILNLPSDLSDSNIRFIPCGETIVPNAFNTSTIAKINEIIENYDEEDDEDGETIENLNEFLSAVNEIKNITEC